MDLLLNGPSRQLLESLNNDYATLEAEWRGRKTAVEIAQLHLGNYSSFEARKWLERGGFLDRIDSIVATLETKKENGGLYYRINAEDGWKTFMNLFGETGILTMSYRCQYNYRRVRNEASDKLEYIFAGHLTYTQVLKDLTSQSKNNKAAKLKAIDPYVQ